MVYLDEPKFKSKKRKTKKVDEKSSLGIIDEEELEHLQSDVDEEENEGSIKSDVDEEDVEVEGISSEPLYVLPLYAILSSDKQARVCFLLFLIYFEKIFFRYLNLHHLVHVYVLSQQMLLKHLLQFLM